MSALSDEFYSREELINKAKENNIPEKHFEEFIKCVEKDLQQMTEDGDFTKAEMKENTIGFSVDFINKFDKELQKGHGEEWAKLYAGSIEEHMHAFNDAYRTIREKNKAEAIEELNIHCNYVGADEDFTRHFIHLFENASGVGEPSPDEQASTYSRIFKEKIKEGKSELFANYYADLMAEFISANKINELGCYAEAAEYEKAINAGHSVGYALNYANEMADYIANYFNSYDEAIKDELYILEKESIEKKFNHFK